MQTNDIEKVEFTDDNGGTFELEIVDYFLFDGQEYVILADTAGLRVDDDNDTEEVDVFIIIILLLENWLHMNRFVDARAHKR